MKASPPEATLGVRDLPDVVEALLARAGIAAATSEMHLTYLRRKAGRGLVAVYRVADRAAASPFVHLAIDERSLDGMTIGFSRDRLERPAHIEATWPGILEDDELGVTVQAFPADAGLPALADACSPAAATPVRAALSHALAELGEGSEAIAAATVAPVRYKPGDRCVLRYRLALEGGGRSSVIGKVYADVDQAAEVYRLNEQLYDEQTAAGEEPLLPRPVGLLEDLGLMLAEDLAAAAPIVGGTTLLRPDGSLVVPAGALEQAAVVLARLHTSSVRPAKTRAADTEAKRAAQRAERLAAFAPAEEAWIGDLQRRLANRLRTDAVAPSTPAHGSFKAAQLVYRADDRVFLTDFDQLCLADPALDVGYFNAYLRPASLWYDRGGTRAWFDGARGAFLDAYAHAMTERGRGEDDVRAIVARSRAYEAALLFKIANRRPNRLQSPRLGELRTLLAEIDACLGNGAV
jgi:hypothetical protein